MGLNETEEEIEINPEHMDHIIKGGPFNHRETIFLSIFTVLAFNLITLIKLGIIVI